MTFVVSCVFLFPLALSTEFEAVAASGFIGLGGTDQDDWIVLVGRAAVNLPVRVASGLTALHANGSQLDDFVGDAQYFRHRAKRFSTEILVKAGEDDSPSAVSETNGQVHEATVEELHFFDADDVAGWI